MTVIAFDPSRRASRRTRTRPTPPPVPVGAPLAGLLPSWRLALEAGNKSVATIKIYTWSARIFAGYLAEHGYPADAEGVDREHARAFIAGELARGAAASAATHWRNLHVFFRWLIAEGERVGPNPFVVDDRPRIPKKARQYLSDEEIRRLLDACRGNSFLARRDTAIIRILADNGVRVSGLTSVRYTPNNPATHDVDLQGRCLRIVLKGGDELYVPLGKKATQALDRYLRVRAGHPHADSPWLWLGAGGHEAARFGTAGVRYMLRRRGEQAGVEGVHPHRFRGTVAHALLRAGATEGDVQRILGWRSRAMIDHYTGELAAERARETHARLSPGDRI